MRAVLQRVSRGRVSVGGETIGSISRGIVALVGAARGDTVVDARYLADKTAHLRIFPDSERPDSAERMNLSLLDIAGELLAVSQFTLAADCRKGRRPSFAAAMAADPAQELFRAYCERTRELGLRVSEGRFGAHMCVEIAGDGPVTLLLDSSLAK